MERMHRFMVLAVRRTYKKKKKEKRIECGGLTQCRMHLHVVDAQVLLLYCLSISDGIFGRITLRKRRCENKNLYLFWIVPLQRYSRKQTSNNKKKKNVDCTPLMMECKPTKRTTDLCHDPCLIYLNPAHLLRPLFCCCVFPIFFLRSRIASQTDKLIEQTKWTWKKNRKSYSHCSCPHPRATAEHVIASVTLLFSFTSFQICCGVGIFGFEPTTNNKQIPFRKESSDNPTS